MEDTSPEKQSYDWKVLRMNLLVTFRPCMLYASMSLMMAADSGREVSWLLEMPLLGGHFGKVDRL